MERLNQHKPSERQVSECLSRMTYISEELTQKWERALDQIDYLDALAAFELDYPLKNRPAKR